MIESPIFQDLKRQLLSDVQGLLNRRINQAAAVLDTAELVFLMNDVAASCVLGAMTLAVSNIRDDADPDLLLKAMEGSVISRCQANRNAVLRTAAAIRRGELVTEAL